MERTLHIIASVDPSHGGPIEGIRQINAATTRMGRPYSAEILSLDAPDAPFLAECPLKVHAVGPGGGGYRYSPQLIPWLRAHARDYDAVILNGLWTYSSYGAYLGLQGSGVPYFVFTHGMLDPYFKTFRLKHLKKCLYWPWAEYRVLRDAAGVCFTCEEERLLARKSFQPYRCIEKVVSYGTAGPSNAAADTQRQREAFLSAWPHLRNKRLLLFLSRVHPKKGCDLLIEAFAQGLSRQNPDVHLVMAGPDRTGWQKELQARAAALGIGDRITWTGMLTGDRKWGAFRSAEAFILPSHQENFGIVVAEALACGTPVLISDKVNIWREIEADGAGLVEPDTFEGTARLLARWLIRDESAQDAMRRKALHCFRTRFEIQRAAQSLIDVLYPPNAPGSGDSGRTPFEEFLRGQSEAPEATAAA